MPASSNGAAEPTQSSVGDGPTASPVAGSLRSEPAKPDQKASAGLPGPRIAMVPPLSAAVSEVLIPMVPPSLPTLAPELRVGTSPVSRAPLSEPLASPDTPGRGDAISAAPQQTDESNLLGSINESLRADAKGSVHTEVPPAGVVAYPRVAAAKAAAKQVKAEVATAEKSACVVGDVMVGAIGEMTPKATGDKSDAGVEVTRVSKDIPQGVSSESLANAGAAACAASPPPVTQRRGASMEERPSSTDMTGGDAGGGSAWQRAPVAESFHRQTADRLPFRDSVISEGRADSAAGSTASDAGPSHETIGGAGAEHVSGVKSPPPAQSNATRLIGLQALDLRDAKVVGLTLNGGSDRLAARPSGAVLPLAMPVGVPDLTVPGNHTLPKDQWSTRLPSSVHPALAVESGENQGDKRRSFSGNNAATFRANSVARVTGNALHAGAAAHPVKSRLEPDRVPIDRQSTVGTTNDLPVEGNRDGTDKPAPQSPLATQAARESLGRSPNLAAAGPSLISTSIDSMIKATEPAVEFRSDPVLNPAHRVRSDQVTIQLGDDTGVQGSVRVSVRGQTVRATITTPDGDSATRLTAGVGELQRNLANQGFTSSRVSVQAPNSSPAIDPRLSGPGSSRTVGSATPSNAQRDTGSDGRSREQETTRQNRRSSQERLPQRSPQDPEAKEKGR